MVWTEERTFGETTTQRRRPASSISLQNPHVPGPSRVRGRDHRDSGTQTVSGRAVGGIAVGSVVEPDSQVSTAAAQERPSAIAQTISD